MPFRLGAVSFLVPDYDAGLAWFRDALGFAVLSDADQGGGRRWVVVGAPNGGSRFVLAKAEGERQIAAIGAATGGRVSYFLETDDFDRDHAALLLRGVAFLEAPRNEPYGKVAVFTDPWGGKWDLIEPRETDPGKAT